MKSSLIEIESFACEALQRFGLYAEGWRFKWDRARRRFGSCNFGKKEITLSRYLASLNDIAQSRDTILHEIAHALAGREAGHGPQWRAACRRVGARPERCYNTSEVVQPKSRYVRYCNNCERVIPVYRRSKSKHACGFCCRKYNQGKYSDKYALLLMERSTYERLLLRKETIPG